MKKMSSDYELIVLEEGHSFPHSTISNDNIAPKATPKAKLPHNKLVWRDVSYRTKDKAVLQQCWGAIPENSLTCIMGPSGAGKSTLLNVLAGRNFHTNASTTTGEVRIYSINNK